MVVGLVRFTRWTSRSAVPDDEEGLGRIHGVHTVLEGESRHWRAGVSEIPIADRLVPESPSPAWAMASW